LSFSQAGGALLSRLYEHTSAIFMTNLAFAEWSNVFIDENAPHIGTHHCHIIETDNASFRYKQSVNSAKIRIQQRGKRKVFTGRKSGQFLANN